MACCPVHLTGETLRSFCRTRLRRAPRTAALRPVRRSTGWGPNRCSGRCGSSCRCHGADSLHNSPAAVGAVAGARPTPRRSGSTAGVAGGHQFLQKSRYAARLSKSRLPRSNSDCSTAFLNRRCDGSRRRSRWAPRTGSAPAPPHSRPATPIPRVNSVRRRLVHRRLMLSLRCRRGTPPSSHTPFATLAETLEPLRKTHRDRLPVRVRQHPVVHQVIKRLAADRDGQIFMRVKSRPQGPRLMHLGEHEFGRFGPDSRPTPLPHPPLEGSSVRIEELPPDVPRPQPVDSVLAAVPRARPAAAPPPPPTPRRTDRSASGTYAGASCELAWQRRMIADNDAPSCQSMPALSGPREPKWNFPYFNSPGTAGPRPLGHP